jgi:hypothetical protein
MIGERIEGGPGFPLGALVWFIIAAAFAIPAAIIGNPHPGIFAVLPVMIGWALVFARQRPFAAQITAEGIDVEEPPLSLPYAAIEAALMPGKPGRAEAPIQLVHAEGVVHIPARLNVRSDELFAFLRQQLPPSDARNLPAALAKYYAEQEAAFGPERIFSYTARPHWSAPRRRVAIAVSLAFALTGVIWTVAGVLLGKNNEAWIVIGIMVAIFGGLFAGAFRFEGRGPRIRNWRQSGLVISPVGLAMVQGDMRGELRWDELRDIRFRARPAFFEVQAAAAPHRGIQLVVAGATIVIADVYNRPLAEIHERLCAYWRGDGIGG